MRRRKADAAYIKKLENHLDTMIGLLREAKSLVDEADLIIKDREEIIKGQIQHIKALEHTFNVRDHHPEL